MSNHITGRSGEDGSMTEAEWETGWKKFWSEASEMSENGNQGPEDQD